MITLITGNPGAGKSALLVSMLGDFAERPLYVSGVPGLSVEHLSLTDEEVSTWPEHLPDGAVCVIDEVQRIWRPRAPGSKVPPAIQAFETHRHHALDFILVTQKASLLDKNIRMLVGRHIHLRHIGILGRRYYENPECVEDCNYKQFAISKSYKLPSSVFEKYHSAGAHTKQRFSVPPALLALGAAFFTLIGGGGYLYYSLSARFSQVEASPKQTAKPVAAMPSASAPAPVVVAEAAPVAGTAAAELPAIVGCMASAKRCLCFGSDGRQITGIDWDLCMASARSYSGLVALALQSPAPTIKPVSTETKVVDSEAPPGAYGFHSGDYRDRPPGTHIVQGRPYQVGQ